MAFKRLVKLSTNNSGDLIIFTDLTEAQIESVLGPIVDGERENHDTVDNSGLYGALLMCYPFNTIEMCDDILEIKL